MKDWKKDLNDFFRLKQEGDIKKGEKENQDKSKAIEFCKSKVIPAFMELKEELEKHGRRVNVYEGLGDNPSISVTYKGNDELEYSIKISRGLRPIPEIHFTDMRNGKRYKSEGYIRSGGQDYTIADISKNEIIKDFLNQYKDHVKYSSY